MSTQSTAWAPIRAHHDDAEAERGRPLLGWESIRAAAVHRAHELGVDLSGVPDDLTIRQAEDLITAWCTDTERAEIASLVQDLWMMIGGRARLRPPPGAGLKQTASGSMRRAAELHEGAVDFQVYLYEVVAAGWRRAHAAGRAPSRRTGQP